MSEWQDISTAPKKGINQFRVILLSRAGQKESMPCYWDGENWKCASVFGNDLIYVHPTHWMPLPSPPEPKE